MDKVLIRLLLHHNGIISELENDRYSSYVGGDVSCVEDKFDIDNMSYPNLMYYVKNLGYSLIGGIYYKCELTREFVLIHDDKGAVELVQNMISSSELHLYVDHAISNPQSINLGRVCNLLSRYYQTMKWEVFLLKEFLRRVAQASL